MAHGKADSTDPSTVPEPELREPELDIAPPSIAESLEGRRNTTLTPPSTPTGGADRSVPIDSANRSVPIDSANRSVPIDSANRSVPIDSANRSVPIDSILKSPGELLYYQDRTVHHSYAYADWKELSGEVKAKWEGIASRFLVDYVNQYYNLLEVTLAAVKTQSRPASVNPSVNSRQ
jgi:hypothetical protein